MKPEELFLSIEQCEHLQELGLDMSDAAFCWILYTNKVCYNLAQNISHIDNKVLELSGVKDIVPTYSLQEVLNKLPESIKRGGSISNLLYSDHVDCRLWYEDYRFSTQKIVDINGDTFLDAAYNMLCWVLENGYYKPLQNVTH